MSGETKSKKKYEIDMCNGAILPKLLAFTLPLMCSSVLQLLFNAADIIVVGNFAGDTALAAVGSNTALINLLTNFSWDCQLVQMYWWRGSMVRRQRKMSAIPYIRRCF